MRWDMVPPLCRPDNIEEKNMEVRQRQQAGSSQDEPVDVFRQHEPILSPSSQDEEFENMSQESTDEPDWT